MEGSATFTTVASSTIISIPMHRTTRATQRERSPAAARARCSAETSLPGRVRLSEKSGVVHGCLRSSMGHIGTDRRRVGRIIAMPTDEFSSSRRSIQDEGDCAKVGA